MFGDLICGCVLVAALAVGLFVLTLVATSSLPRRTLNLVGVLVVCCLAFYIQNVWYDVRLARWLPFACLIVVGNWLPLFAAMLAAIAWQSSAHSRPRQIILTGTLILTGSYALVSPLLGSAPECDDRWDKLGTCIQTTNLTCSPACAATLLQAHGIRATEQEMAELCLTRHGTSWQGLYRGLKLKTAGTPWDVEIVACRTGDLRRLADRPLILSVGLESGLPADTDFTREFGWVPGVNHSVVLTGFTSNGLAVIADPSLEMSREQWDGPTLQVLWRGYAIRLVRRER